MAAKKPKKSKAALIREQRAAGRAAALARRQRAIEMHNAGVIQARIADELKLSTATVGRWLREAGVPARPMRRDVAEDDVLTPVSFNDKLAETTDGVIADALIEARTKEEQAILQVAENQGSPADQYQAYVAGSAIRLLRDNLANVRGPRTVKELSELDQLIRRNLGLNPRGGAGAGGGLTIDISILNNTKADLSADAPAGSTVNKRKIILDAEVFDPEDDGEYGEDDEEGDYGDE